MFVTTPPKKSLIHLKFQLPGTYFETPSVPVPSVSFKIRISAILSPTLSIPMTNRPYFEKLAYKNILRLVVRKSPTGESTRYFFVVLK